MKAPADIRTASLTNVTYAGPAGALQSDALMVAPGAGLRYRLFGVTVTKFGTTAANRAQITELWVQGAIAAGGGIVRLMLSMGAGEMGKTEWIPGGVLLADNANLDLQQRTDTVGANLRVSAYYTLEST